MDSIPGSGRSPGGGHGIPFQCSCLENPRDGGAWWAAVYGVAQSQTRLKRLSSSSSSKHTQRGFPGGASSKEHACQCRRCKRGGFNPWVRKILWKRACQPTPVFFPGESHGPRSLEGYNPQGRTELDMTEVTWHTHTQSSIELVLQPDTSTKQSR